MDKAYRVGGGPVNRSGPLVLLALAAAGLGVFALLRTAGAPVPQVAPSSPSPRPSVEPAVSEKPLLMELLKGDDSGFMLAQDYRPHVADPTDLEAVQRASRGLGQRAAGLLQPRLAGASPDVQLRLRIQIAAMHLYEGKFAQARQSLREARALVEPTTGPLARYRPDVLWLQAVAALRAGEVDNCVQHQCPSSCILPLDAKAVHGVPAGSREAIEYLGAYLEVRPRDALARWLLNIAHMTLGQYPGRVPPGDLVPPSTFTSAMDIGRFPDIAARAGVNRVGISGGAVMDDFDGDGLLDIVESTRDLDLPPAFFRNRGDGTFEEEKEAGLTHQSGALTIVQTDYDNDGALDIWMSRGGWESSPVRHSLLRNNLDGTFTDVTFPARLKYPMCSQASAWGDFDRDGWLDVFCGGERERNRLYRNRGDGTFEEVGVAAGVTGSTGGQVMCKGASFGDFDRDGWPDLLVSNRGGPPGLFRNNHDSTFTDVAPRMRISKPVNGFSCWFWDHDNDGWLDIYVSEFGGAGSDAARAMMGQTHALETGRLYRNLEGKAFEDVTAAAGLDRVIIPMGSNFVDVDNDGFLDCYFGTGDTLYSMLLPNRLFKNVDGRRFVDITYSSGTGHLQKGHQIACGDFDRDGDLDIYAQLGGAVPGDRFANALFLNPGHLNNSITVKLVGTRINRLAIGARIKIVLAGDPQRVISRHVTSGSSFGANALEQTIGLGRATRIARLEINWPASGTIQTLRDLPVNTSIEVTEGQGPIAPGDASRDVRLQKPGHDAH